MLDSFGPDCVAAVIEVGCAPFKKKTQAHYNANALANALLWGGYQPQAIYTGISYWNGGVSLCDDVDFYIKHVDIDPEAFDVLDEFIIASEKKNDKKLERFVDRVQEGRLSFDRDYVRKLIAYEGQNSKYSNVRGLLSEIISKKTILKNIGEHGELMEITVEAPRIKLNKKAVYSMDADRELDLVVCSPDKEEFSKVLDNLRKYRYIELTINPSSGLY